MIYIAVCDDDKKVGAEVESALINIFNSMQVKHEIDVIFSGEELCRRMEAGTHYDLIFLDIEFARPQEGAEGYSQPKGEINGVEVGRLIREAQQNNMVSIVYISRERDYAFQLFEIRPLNFLVKPLSYDALEKTVKTYLKIAGLWSSEFSYNAQRTTLKVKMKDILYVESSGRKLILHFANGKTSEFYGSLKEVYQEQLKKYDFLFIHASYIVNFDYISAIKYNQLSIIGSAESLPISQGRRNETRERYFEIMKRRRV